MGTKENESENKFQFLAWEDFFGKAIYLLDQRLLKTDKFINYKDKTFGSIFALFMVSVTKPTSANNIFERGTFTLPDKVGKREYNTQAFITVYDG